LNHRAAHARTARPSIAPPAAGRRSIARSPIALAAAAAALLLAVAGCGLGTTAATDSDRAAAPAATGAAAGTTSPTAASGLGDSVKDAGDIPNPCTLLSRAEVTSLTGRDITQIDEDGGNPGDATRYCQWQQDSGQLAVFLSRTTEDEFTIKIDGATPVDGVGEDAFELAGHLYVLYGTVAVDVYSRGDSDAENLAKAKDVVRAVLPKI
jgi:hypothetical protein